MKPTISIIGTGALGGTLARALSERRYRIKSLYNRTPDPARQLADELGADSHGTFPGSRGELGELLFISVSDSAIAEIAEQLSVRIGDLDGITVAHCSGNDSSTILTPLRERGATTAAFHPLQTFNASSGPDAFRGIHVSMEGGRRAVSLLSAVAEELGATVLPIAPDAKPYLHAAAVVASNYLVALMETAGEMAELGGIDPRAARKALLPLAETALNHSDAPDLSSVLSGPIARGDINTVCNHLKILEHKPGLLSLYKTIGLETLKLSERKGSISEEDLEKLKSVLSR